MMNNKILEKAIERQFDKSNWKTYKFADIADNIVEKIIPKIKNNEWFFDLELVILSEKFGYKIK